MLRLCVCKPGIALVLLVALSSCYPGLHHAGQGQPPARALLLANDKIEVHQHLGGGRAEVLPRIVLILRGGAGGSSSVAGIDHRRRGEGVVETDRRREDEGEGAFDRSGAGERRQRVEVMTKGEGEEGSQAPLPRRPRLHTEGAYTPPDLRLEEVEEDLSGEVFDRGGDDHGNAEPRAPQPPPPFNHTLCNEDPEIEAEAAVKDGDAEGHRKDEDKDEGQDKDKEGKEGEEEELDDTDEMLFAQDSDEDFDLANSTRKYKTNSEEEREWHAGRGIFPWLDADGDCPEGDLELAANLTQQADEIADKLRAGDEDYEEESLKGEFGVMGKVEGGGDEMGSSSEEEWCRLMRKGRGDEFRGGEKDKTIKHERLHCTLVETEATAARKLEREKERRRAERAEMWESYGSDDPDNIKKKKKKKKNSFLGQGWNRGSSRHQFGSSSELDSENSKSAPSSSEWSPPPKAPMKRGTWRKAEELYHAAIRAGKGYGYLPAICGLGRLLLGGWGGDDGIDQAYGLYNAALDIDPKQWSPEMQAFRKAVWSHSNGLAQVSTTSTGDDGGADGISGEVDATGTFIPNYWDPRVSGKTPFPRVPIPRPEKKQVMTKEEAAEAAALEKMILDVGKADRVGWVSEQEAYPCSDWDKALP